MRSSRPDAGPASWTIRDPCAGGVDDRRRAAAAPGARRSRRSPARRVPAGRAPAVSSSTDSSMKSPAWRIASASRRCATQAGGKRTPPARHVRVPDDREPHARSGPPPRPSRAPLRAGATAAEPLAQAASASSRVDRAGQLLRLCAYVSSRIPNPVSWIRWALSCWSQKTRQQHHRLAEVERLGDGVVAAVGDRRGRPAGRIDVCGRNSAPAMLSRELELVVLRALRDDHAVAARRRATRSARCISSTSPEPSEPRLR